MWKKLYNEARRVQNGRTVSPFIDAGGVASAILTKSGNIYVGVCIDTASTLGMCAERNAIANMLTNGESKIDKVVAVMPDGKVGSPCGACREYMMQLDRNSADIEILLDLETEKTVRLGELIPDWWGRSRFENEISEAICRIERMEAIFCELSDAVFSDPTAIKSPKLYEKLRVLKDYYDNEWLRDYELDEDGAIPSHIKRGVLSQDAVFDLLSKIHE